MTERARNTMRPAPPQALALPQRSAHTLGHARWQLNYALGKSTVGVAIFDKDLRCRASNQAFASLTGVTVQQHLGKTLEEMLGAEVVQFRDTLQQVWMSQETLREQKIKIASREAGERIWLVDFFPIHDVVGCIQMVGAVFSELTARHNLERRLLRMTRQHQHNGENGRSADQDDLALGQVELMEQTVKLLNRSMALRRAISEIRIGATLRRYSLMFAAENLSDAMEITRNRMVPGASEAQPLPPPAEQPVGGSNAPSPREMQVVRFLAEGKSNKEIAYFLSLSTRTVETYRSRLMAKLKVHSAAEIVRYAIRNNLIQA